MSRPRLVAVPSAVAILSLAAACGPAPPAKDATTEIAIPSARPIASSRRGDDRPPSGPRNGAVLQQAAGPTDEDRERDPRIRTLSRTLLVSEAEQLAALLAQTSRSAPDRAMVMIRVGHAFGAVEGAAWQEGDRVGAETARREALTLYDSFLADHPQHPSVPEALYFGGLDEERQGRLDHARKRWFKVVSEHPQHPLAPACYYGFGVLFRAEAANDPAKHGLARQSFEEVVKYPASPLARRARTLLDTEYRRSDGAL